MSIRCLKFKGKCCSISLFLKLLLVILVNCVEHMNCFFTQFHSYFFSVLINLCGYENNNESLIVTQRNTPNWLPLAAALEKMAEVIEPISDTETIAISAAKGRIAAQNVYSPINVPPFANSAMDGYACLLYTSPSPRDMRRSRMPSSA